ncbi:hypothetical protein QQF64_020679 [Cirrhinus molitorella]|uniref:Uncharacterized protein n=1 Tax=Cirrhinus molitorella TaxID=172907 RepID=A0ABR3LD90_9TELE
MMWDAGSFSLEPGIADGIHHMVTRVGGAESGCQSSAVSRIGASQTFNGWMGLLTSILPRRKHNRNTIIVFRRSEQQTTDVEAI